MEEFIVPSVRERKRANFLLFLAVSIFGIMSLISKIYIGYIYSLPKCDQGIWLINTLWVCSLLPFLIGSWLIYISIRILQSGQYPHQSAFVMQKAPIIRGQKAKARGLISLALSLAIIGCGFFIAHQVSKIQDKISACSPNKSFQPTAYRRG